MSSHRIFLLSRTGGDLRPLLAEGLPAGWGFTTVEQLSDVREHASAGDALLILADDYPHVPVRVNDDDWGWLEQAGLRIYLEYPEALPLSGNGVAKEVTRLERAWYQPGFVRPDALGSLSTLTLKTYPTEQAWIRIGKLAGYDQLAFPADDTPTDALLFLHQPHLLVAATALSRFVTGRFAPSDLWHDGWQAILRWLLCAPDFELPVATPLSHASYGPQATLPENAARSAIERSLRWFGDARMLLAARHEALYQSIAEDGFMPDERWQGGDGTGGVLEGYLSEFAHDGRQPVRCWRRADCVSETAASFALGSLLCSSQPHAQTAANLSDWLYTTSNLFTGDRANPEHPAYGLIGWHDRAKYGRFAHAHGWDTYYGDDNARVILGTIACAGALQSDRWLTPIVRNILANLRTAGTHGLRECAIWNDTLTERGWESYAQSDDLPPEWISPHYQCYLSACYLWLYRHAGDPLLLERAVSGLTILMEAYPERWRWTNGLQQERARMLLPLAWLYRVTQQPEHLVWLQKMAADLLAHQTECGALREVLAAGEGKYGPPQRHDEYGTREASLLQNDGDPVSDLLYTCNFAFLGLHEAAAATGDATLQRTSDRLADYLIRIQTTSTRPELSGAWYRTFDYRRWETWGSDADGAWGAWCVETGWTQSWITSVLALREVCQSLWDLYQPEGIKACYAHEKSVLFPSAAIVS